MAEEKGLSPIVEVRRTLAGMEAQLKAALPPHVSVEYFIRIVVTALTNPEKGIGEKLLACDRGSLYRACLLCAQDGLLPDGREAALVPYSARVGYLPMWRGIRKLVDNTGLLASLSLELVPKEFVEHFRSWTDDDGPHIEYRPPGFVDVDQLTAENTAGGFCVATLTNGGRRMIHMSTKQIEKIRQKSQAKREDSPWAQWWDEMARKTLFKRLSKQLPLSPVLQRVLDRDDDFEARDVTDDGPRKIGDGKPKRLSSLLETITKDSPGASTPEERPAPAVDGDETSPPGSTANVPESELLPWEKKEPKK